MFSCGHCRRAFARNSSRKRHYGTCQALLKKKLTEMEHELEKARVKIRKLTVSPIEQLSVSVPFLGDLREFAPSGDMYTEEWAVLVTRALRHRHKTFVPASRATGGAALAVVHTGSGTMQYRPLYIVCLQLAQEIFDVLEMFAEDRLSPPRLAAWAQVCEDFKKHRLSVARSILAEVMTDTFMHCQEETSGA